ncbi:MULE domain-containing protein [Trichonephila clavipes]|nr:MULE domain-containing protein [Trichonephila clavipes]
MQLEVYKILRILMEEKDVDAFNIMFNEGIKKTLDNDMIKEFCKYFVESYAHCINSWAYCHHLQPDLNPNMHVESKPKMLKYIYLKGNAKRSDKTIYALMRFIRDKLVDRLIVMTKGKLKYLRQCQKTSLSLSTAMIIKKESGYIVPSSSSHETYLVQDSNTNCSYTLFRAYLKDEVNDDPDIFMCCSHAVKELPISEPRIAQFKMAIKSDSKLNIVYDYCKRGWPDHIFKKFLLM